MNTESLADQAVGRVIRGEPFPEQAAQRPMTFAHQVAVVQGYEDLFAVLTCALNQAQDGKGSERHGNGLPFKDQPIAWIADAVGMGFQTGQAIKKANEAHGMIARGDRAAARRELLGAINYLAAAIMHIEKSVERELK